MCIQQRFMTAVNFDGPSQPSSSPDIHSRKPHRILSPVCEGETLPNLSCALWDTDLELR
jgi:hypothetical protein